MRIVPKKTFEMKPVCMLSAVSYNTGVPMVVMYGCCVKPTLNKLEILEKNRTVRLSGTVDQFLCFKLTMYLYISILDSRILQRKKRFRLN